MHWLHFYQSRCFLQKIINTSMLRIQNKHLKKCITGEQLIQRKLRIWVKLAITLYSNVHFQWIIKHFHKILRSTTLSASIDELVSTVDNSSIQRALSFLNKLCAWDALFKSSWCAFIACWYQIKLYETSLWIKSAISA